jgi:PBP1b-binding outer membrane lipoprotein LpoB
MKVLIITSFLLASCVAIAQDEKKEEKKAEAPKAAAVVPSDCIKIAQASDTQETTVFECVRKHKGDTIYCNVVKSGMPNGVPAVAVSCVKL